MNSDDVGRHLAPAASSSASISPVSTISTIFSSIVLPIPWQLLRLPVERELGDEPAVSRMRVAARR